MCIHELRFTQRYVLTHAFTAIHCFAIPLLSRVTLATITPAVYLGSKFQRIAAKRVARVVGDARISICSVLQRGVLPIARRAKINFRILNRNDTPGARKGNTGIFGKLECAIAGVVVCHTNEAVIKERTVVGMDVNRAVHSYVTGAINRTAVPIIRQTAIATAAHTVRHLQGCIGIIIIADPGRAIAGVEGDRSVRANVTGLVYILFDLAGIALGRCSFFLLWDCLRLASSTCQHQANKYHSNSKPSESFHGSPPLRRKIEFSTINKGGYDSISLLISDSIILPQVSVISG